MDFVHPQYFQPPAEGEISNFAQPLRLETRPGESWLQMRVARARAWDPQQVASVDVVSHSFNLLHLLKPPEKDMHISPPEKICIYFQ